VTVYIYRDKLHDSVFIQGKTYDLNPDSSIDLDEDAEKEPYFKRLIALGLLTNVNTMEVQLSEQNESGQTKSKSQSKTSTKG
jgi:hypothetical protein